MRVCLVLGAGGFIGKNLCRELAKEFQVIAFDCHYCEEFEEMENVRQIIGSFSEITDFSSLLCGVDIVYHLIGTTLPSESLDNIDQEVRNVVIPTLLLLNEMVKSNVRKLVFVSSGGTVYGERGDEICNVSDRLKPQCSYAVHKQVLETYLEFYNRCTDLNCIIARVSNPYGMGQDIHRKQGVIPIFVHNILHGAPIKVWGGGASRRDYIYMDDLVKALLRMANYTGNETIFNVGSGKSHTLLEIIQMIQRLSGREFLHIEWLPNRKIDVSNVSLNIENTMKELSWKPETSLEEGISRIINRYAEQIDSG